MLMQQNSRAPESNGNPVVSFASISHSSCDSTASAGITPVYGENLFQHALHASI